MKKTSIIYGLGSLLLFCSSFISYEAQAHGIKYYEEKCVNNWNLVDREGDFFHKNEFQKYYPSMPGNSWIKSTGSTYDESGGGASHITKFTTKAGAYCFEPEDGVLYKFKEGEENKSITVNIADPGKEEDNKLYIAVLIANKWRVIASFKTTGKYCYVKHKADLPDDAEAVLLYTPGNNVDVYLGATCISSSTSTTLPVAFYDVIAKRSTGSISWKVGDPSGIDSYLIEGSNDASNWVKIKTIEASGASSYTTVLTDMSQSGRLYVWLMLALLPLGFVKTKGKRHLIMAMGSIILLSGAMISCSKSESVPQPKENSLYKYYRVQSLKAGEITETSKVITLE